MELFTVHSLNQSLAELGARSGSELFPLLHKLHTDPARRYHSNEHINACLAHFGEYRPTANRPAEIEIAFWFHDAIYDTRRSDNEEKSAELAATELSSLGVKSEAITRISEMILATKSHQPNTTDAALVVDIDLGILGASLDIFERYDSAIREEYYWVPEEQYRLARANVLDDFLKRTYIYHTVAIREVLENRARDNLRRKIAELRT